MINEIKNKLNLKEQIKDILLDNEIKDNLLKYFEEKMSDNYINKKEIINIIELKEKEINDKLDERHERHKDLESKINNNLINIKKNSTKIKSQSKQLEEIIKIIEINEYIEKIINNNIFIQNIKKNIDENISNNILMKKLFNEINFLKAKKDF